MSEVASVNEKPTGPVEESEAAGEPWVDPIFLDRDSPLPDDPDNASAFTPPEKTGEPEKPQLTEAQLKALLDANKGAGEQPGATPAEEAGAAGKADGEPGGKPDEKAEEADASAKDDKDEDGEKPQGRKNQRRQSKAQKERRLRDRRMRERYDREIADLRSELETLKAGTAVQDGDQAAPEQPKLEDFETADDWAEAMSKFVEDKISAERKKDQDAAKAKAAEEARKAAGAVVEAFAERADAARDKYGDDEFDDAYAAASFVKISDEVSRMVMESELGAEIVYYLGTHEKEAAAFADMNDAQAAREIGKIEARIQAEQAKPSGDPDDAAGDESGDAAGDGAGDAAAEKAGDGNPANPETGDGEGAGKASPAEGARATEPTQQRPPVTAAPEPIPDFSGGSANPRDPNKMSYEEYRDARMSGRLR